mgnify:CR=1 FL=1
MKCSNCGKNNLKKVRLNQLFYIEGDAWLHENKTAEIYICADCGHFEFFNSEYANELKIQQKANDYLMQKIEEKKSQIKELKEIKFDPTPFEKEIEKLEKEIETLKSLGVNGQEIRWREDEIKRNKEILAKKIDPKLKYQIEHLEYAIENLQKQIVNI